MPTPSRRAYRSVAAAALAVLAALAFAAAVVSVSAQKAPSSRGAVFECAKMEAAKDPKCAIFPLPSALPAGQSESNIRKMKAVELLCSAAGKAPQSLPLFVCFTPLGNCNGHAWPLPRDETDLAGAVELYNTVRFGDLKPDFEKAGAPDKMMCAEDCGAMLAWMRNCPQAFGNLSKTHDVCEGLPKRSAGDKCIAKVPDELQDGAAAADAAAGANAGSAQSDSKAKAKGAADRTAAATLQVAVAAAAVALVGGLALLA